MRKWMIGAALVAVAGAAVGIAIGVSWLRNYGHRTVTIAGDQIGCVYGDAASGHRFERSIQPGERARVGNGDQLVVLPTGDQIYNVTTSPNRTEQAPSRVLAFTQGQTAVWVEGVLKFRFNTAGDKACRWYSKYGLQTASYGDLEDRELLLRRVDEASQFVDVEQLCLSPQCGFSSTFEGNDLTFEQEVAKLRLIVEVAEEVWG